MQSRADFNHKTPPRHVIPYLWEHPDESAPGWHNWPNVQRAFRDEWPTWVASPPPRKRFKYPRGVVMIGGGPVYGIGLFVAVRALRHFGWEGPIQIWHRGDDEPLNYSLFAPFDVGIIDACKYRDASKHPPRRWGMDKWDDPKNRWLGWGLKSYAVLHSPFRRVFYQDADWYTTSPGSIASCFEALDASGVGSVLWYDFISKRGDSNDHTINWKLHGFDTPPDPATTLDIGKGVQGGQWIIDKEHHQAWAALNLYRRLDDFSDYYYRHHYGDQDSLRLAWAMCGAPRHSFPGRCWIRRGAMIARGPAGEFLGVHRVGDKQFHERMGGLPWEDLAHQWAEEYRRLVK